MLTRFRPHVLLPAAGFIILALIYGSTVQTDINGRSIPAMIDVGELQVALSSWGTTHSTGYPLYTIVANLLVELGRLAGIAPVAVTSAISYVAVMLAFTILYVLMWQATHSMAAGAATVLLLALSPILWLNGLITEVYALNIFFVSLALYLAWRMQQGTRVPPLVMVLVLAVAVSHHRTTAMILPAFAVLLWSPVRSWLAGVRKPQGPGLPRAITPLALAALAPFALYVYLPLRYIQQATWIYENWRYGLSEPVKLTLLGFISYESGREYAPYVDIPRDLPGYIARAQELTDMWSLELGLLCLAGGLLGMALALRGKHARLAVALWLALAGYSVFAAFYHVKDISSLVTGSFIPLVIGAGLLVAWVGERLRRIAPGRAALPALGSWAVAAVLLAQPLSHLPAQYADISGITHDPAGRQVIDAAKRIPVDCPTVYSLWGIDFFAYSYGKLSTHELPCIKILPLHRDIRQNWQAGERVFVASHFFYQTPVDQLEQSFGRLYLRSAGFGNVELAPQPATAPGQALSGSAVDMGGVITLLGYQLQRSSDGKTLYLSLYWRANNAQRPDYSVFVHASDKPAISGAADIVSQADSLHPVYGWYPTSRWSAGEVVRDDYAIAESAERPTQMIAVGLYQTQSGAFTNLGGTQIMVSDR